MTEERTPAARTPGWQQEHARRYIETDGAEGHIWNGVPTLLLTTTGRHSGEQRMTPLIYGEDSGRYLVVGSRGGAAQHPQWYLNLRANPEVHVQVKADRFPARARRANKAEKPALWAIMAKIFQNYEDYQKRTTRPIPVVILEKM